MEQQEIRKIARNETKILFWETLLWILVIIAILTILAVIYYSTKKVGYNEGYVKGEIDKEEYIYDILKSNPEALMGIYNREGEHIVIKTYDAKKPYYIGIFGLVQELE